MVVAILEKIASENRPRAELEQAIDHSLRYISTKIIIRFITSEKAFLEFPVKKKQRIVNFSFWKFTMRLWYNNGINFPLLLLL